MPADLVNESTDNDRPALKLILEWLLIELGVDPKFVNSLISKTPNPEIKI